MTASGVQPKIGSGRRIIERPRLIKLLDETEARTILLLAPAGYGKTTLARQWLKGTSKSIYLALAPSDRDVAWLSEEIARELSVESQAAAALIREHVRAQPHPQRASAHFGRAIPEALASAGTQLLILDNYESVAGSPESEQLVGLIAESPLVRLLVASRLRPAWANGRRAIYGDTLTIDRADLEMTEEEVARVVGPRRAAAELAKQARGWPAVIGLAATLEPSLTLPNAVPQGLHRYLAEEILSRVSPVLREDLFAIALYRDGARALVEPRRHGHSSVYATADELGFGSTTDGAFELHPLVEEFLLGKLLEERDGAERVREAIRRCLNSGAWDRALELTVRYRAENLAEHALEAAFKPLTRAGRFSPLLALAAQSREDGGFGAPAADLVFAEVAFCDGNIELARQLAERAGARLGNDHPLASRAATISAQARFQLADFVGAHAAYSAARKLAEDELDETDALHGLASATTFGEHPEASVAVHALFERRHRSPVEFARWLMADISYRQVGGAGLREYPPLEVVLQTLPAVDDPRARSALIYTTAYALTTAAEYDSAYEFMERFDQEARRFHLEFTQPLANYVHARVALGQRRYGDAERALQTVEDHAIRSRDDRHRLNAAGLRSRLLLQNGDAEGALACVAVSPSIPVIPSWRGEYLAARAVALATLGMAEGAVAAAAAARSASIAHEVAVLATAAEAVAKPADDNLRRNAIDYAARMNVWDPILCVLRSAPTFAADAATDPVTRLDVGDLCQRAEDGPLARRLGFRHRSTARPNDVLSPREVEVLGLVARGHTNREISRALYIADSTTKVHIRHIFEKLGVRTRAEAVARYEMFRSTGSGDS